MWRIGVVEDETIGSARNSQLFGHCRNKYSYLALHKLNDKTKVCSGIVGNLLKCVVLPDA